MLTAETLPTEGDRYAARLVFLPELWTETQAWRGFASFLGHRGWECHLLELRAVEGGLATRAAAVGEYVAALGVPAVLIGHGAGALTALAAVSRVAPAALVLLAPLVAGRAARALVRSPRALLALVCGRPVPPPSGGGAEALVAGLPAPVRAQTLAALGPDAAAAVADVVWGRLPIRPAAPVVPTLLVRGEGDPLLSPPDAGTLARTLGADEQGLDGAGHWLIAGPTWQRAADLVHRWIVQRLGAPLLELYPEAMAEREAEEGDGE
jgi:hypothetical protein